MFGRLRNTVGVHFVCDTVSMLLSLIPFVSRRAYNEMYRRFSAEHCSHHYWQPRAYAAEIHRDDLVKELGKAVQDRDDLVKELGKAVQDRDRLAELTLKQEYLLTERARKMDRYRSVLVQAADMHISVTLDNIDAMPG